MNQLAAGLPPVADLTGFEHAVAEFRKQLDGLAAARRLGSDEEYRRLADSVPLIVWVADPDGRARSLNQGWYDYTGLDAQRSVGYGWNDVIHRDDLDRAFSRWTHAINTGEPLEVAYRFRRDDGAYRWHLGGATLRRASNDRAIEWVGGCLDVHDFLTDATGAIGLTTAGEAASPSTMPEITAQS